MIIGRFSSMQWYQPESAGGLHRKKKKPIAGRSQAYSEQTRDGGFNSARRQELRAACNQDFPGRAANPPNCD
jgi:hypothetical protein